MDKFPPGAMGVTVRIGGSKADSYYFVYATRGSLQNNTLIYPGERFDSVWKAQKYAGNMAREIAKARQIPIKLVTQEEIGGRVKGNTRIVHPTDTEITEDLRRFTLIMKR